MRALCLAAACACLIAAAVATIRANHNAGALTHERHRLLAQERKLRNLQRSLQMEYAAVWSFEQTRKRALALGMRDPSLQDGSLFYLPREEGGQ